MRKVIQKIHYIRDDALSMGGLYSVCGVNCSTGGKWFEGVEWFDRYKERYCCKKCLKVFRKDKE